MSIGMTRRTALRWLGALLALSIVGFAPASGVDARGGAPTAVYVNGYDVGGYIYIQGDGFTIGGAVEVWVYDDSWGWASSPSDYQVVTATRLDYWTSCGDGDPYCVGTPMTTGVIDLYSGPYCPRLLTIYAHDVTSGTWVSYEFVDDQCPW